jgi:ParB/RepB/Spo0J family partition protein
MLTTRAISQASVLRAIKATPFSTVTDIAQATGKVASNLRRDLPRLVEDGLIHVSDDGARYTMSDAGRSAIELLDESEGRRAVEAAAGDLLMLRWEQITPDPLNARRSFDEEELGLLADSISASGLMQNLVVGPATLLECITQPVHVLVAGERRWRAIRMLVKDGRWPEDRLIPCKLMIFDSESERAIAGLLENLVRADLTPMEEARAYKALRDTHNIPTAEIAERIHRTPRLVQQRMQLLELSPEQQASVDSGELKIEQARNILRNRPAPVVMSAVDRLALLEIALKQGGPENQAERVECAPDLGETAHRWIYTAVDEETGRNTVWLAWGANNALDQVAPTWRADLHGAIDDAALAAAAQGADITQGAHFYTPWLNGPFEVPPERAEEAVEWAAQNAAAEQRRRDQQANREAEAAERRALHDEVERVAAENCIAEIPALLTRLGAPMPWSVDEDGDLLDLMGDYVNAEDESIARLIAFAMNRIESPAK